MPAPASEVVVLDGGWEAAPVPAGADAPAADAWRPARVPGTVAAVLRDAGQLGAPELTDLDAEAWWFRTRFTAPDGDVVLRFGGIATVSEVWLDGARVLESTSMFAEHSVPAIGAGEHELVVRCLALAPLLRVRRRPRARWRTKVADGGLRWFRTSLLGRAPGFAPGPAPVGPWRPVWLERRAVVVDDVRVRPRVEPEGTGVVDIALTVPDAAVVEARAALTGPSGAHEVALARDGERLTGELRVPGVVRWWPHTHGEPVLHDLAIDVVLPGGGERVRVDARRIGFRTLTPGPPGQPHELDRDGLALWVNGVPVFARGAVWTGADPVGLAPSDAELRRTLERWRDAGGNLLRIVGTGAYEDARFHDLCDELGILVWQDFMFANFDYPVADPDFRATVEAEARQVLGALAGRPSLAVLCGNSEIEQQVAMLGLDPALGRGELFGELLPAAIAESGTDAVWIASAPTGGALPFLPHAGVANYFGVGGYRRPIEDVRRAEVKFASECLAFANVPDEAAVERVLPGAPGDVVVHHPRWKAGVPRDAGTGWDFDDVRDHYLRTEHGVDPVALRGTDHERYLELSRAVTGEVMAEVFGEWRRAASPCAGGIVLWLRDLVPGAGWGLLDERGEPKLALHHLRRVLAPIAVWTTDEGMNGVAIHAANDTAEAVEATLTVTLVRDGEDIVDSVAESVVLAPRSAPSWTVEGLLGRFADAGYAYRFGPPGHHAVGVRLDDARTGAALSQSFRFPAGRPLAVEPAERLGLEAGVSAPGADGSVAITVTARRLVYGVRVHAPGWEVGDGGFTVLPGGTWTVRARPVGAAGADAAWPASAAVTALNLRGRVRAAAPVTSA